jgi:predicted ATP-grasp superfamily ATP-dependent carboligase
METLPSTGRLICKPVDAFSGRGISIFEASDQRALEKALEVAVAASPSGRSVVETFVEGQLHSCSGFLESGRLVDTFYVIEGSSANLFAVDTSYVTDDVPSAYRVELEASLETLAAELMLADGLIHTQFLLAEDGAYVVEVSRRCPGDLYSLLIEFATGYPYAARYASFFLGNQITTSVSDRRHILRHTVTADCDCVYGGLKLDRALPVHSFFPLQSVGQTLLARQGNRAGILFCEASNHSDLIKTYRQFHDRQAYRVT